jgi:hypothetical protein
LIIGAFWCGSHAKILLVPVTLSLGQADGFNASLDLANLNGEKGFAINGLNSGDRSALVSNAGDVMR